MVCFDPKVRTSQSYFSKIVITLQVVITSVNAHMGLQLFYVVKAIDIYIPSCVVVILLMKIPGLVKLMKPLLTTEL